MFEEVSLEKSNYCRKESGSSQALSVQLKWPQIVQTFLSCLAKLAEVKNVHKCNMTDAVSKGKVFVEDDSKITNQIQTAFSAMSPSEF